MSKEVAILPDPNEISERRDRVTGIQKYASAIVVNSQEMVNEGAHMLREIKDVETSLIDRKTEITRPLMQALASARDLFKPFETGLADAKKTIKEKIVAYTIEQDSLALAEADKLEKRVDKGTMKAETAAAKLEKLELNRVHSNTRTLRKLSIVDETLIPREYLTVNREMVTKALFAGTEVPGAQLVEEKKVVIK